MNKHEAINYSDKERTKEESIGEFEIKFGTTEKESPEDYKLLTVSLDQKITKGERKTDINIMIESGLQDGQFDMERKIDTFELSVEDAKILVNKLMEFIKKGE